MTAHGNSFEFPLAVAFLDVFPLVILDFAFRDRQGNFDFSVLPVKRERNQRIALDRGQPKQFPNFGLVQQQLADALRLVVLDIAVSVLVYVGVVEKDLIVFDSRKGIPDLPPARAQGLYFSAFKNDASLEGLENVIVAAGFRIRDDVPHKQKQPEAWIPWLFQRCEKRLVLTPALGRGLCFILLHNHFPSQLLFNDFQHRDVARPQPGRVRNQWTTARAAAGQLSDAPRDQIHQNVWVANLLQCFLCNFAIQFVLSFVK